MLSKKTGDFVKCGDVIATLYTNNESLVPKAEEIFLSALEFSDKEPQKTALILDSIE